MAAVITGPGTICIRPKCSCRLHSARPCLRPARYEWTRQDGTKETLCETCCANWRANAARNSVLLPPRRIRELPGWRPIGTVGSVQWEDAP